MHRENQYYLEAYNHLTALDCTTSWFCYQTFDDWKERSDPGLAKTLHGSLDEHFETLQRLNRKGAGVFATVNRIKFGRPRKIENLDRCVGIHQDDDKGFQGHYPLAPSIVVQSSPGKFQRIWCVACLKPDMHQALMRRLTQHYGSDPGAHDLVRVLRLPGFLHQKDPQNPFRVKLLASPGWVYSVEQIAAAFPPIYPEPYKTTAFDPHAFDKRELWRLLEALACIPADDRSTWLRVGMALRREYGDHGRDLWDGWSKTSSKFNEKDQQKAWHSFKRASGVGMGTVFHLARENGFQLGHGGR
jgi:hypothetical protein